jgi:site-specific DNA-cytosine methylase
MSFPDSYIFDLDSVRVDDIVRQLRNAVPPNFAHALARPLLDVLVDKFEEEQQTF